MKIDLRIYKNIDATIASVCKNNPYKGHEDLVAIGAVAAGVPAIVAAYYYAKHIGTLNEETKRQIKRLIDFYGYKEIIGIEDVLGRYEV